MAKSHIITITFQAIPTKEEALKEYLTSIIELAEQSPGCLKHEVYQCVDDVSSFMLYESWTNEQAHSEHVAKPEVKTWIAGIDVLLAEPCKIKRWQV